MKKINIKTDGSTKVVPILITFQGAPEDNFETGEEVLIQLVNDLNEKIGEPAKRSVIKTHDGENNEGAWYDAYIPKI